MNGYSPFHEGELAVQERLGEQQQAAKNGQSISDCIILGALPFIAQQPMVVVGTAARDGNVWASLLIGRPGFMQAPDGSAVDFDLSPVRQIDHDPMWDNLANDPRVGMLIIELSTRRRLRVNGRWVWGEDDHARVEVVESYANCPKYIQKRAVQFHEANLFSLLGPRTVGNELNDEQTALIRRSDTFFVASANPKGQIDASHRGGAAGFVEVTNPRTLRIPDYPGNSMYNTMGNWMVNPQTGLLFVDFDSHRHLQLTGRVEIRWDKEATGVPTGGTNRFWDFHVDQLIETEWPAVLTWTLTENSPYNPR